MTNSGSLGRAVAAAVAAVVVSMAFSVTSTAQKRKGDADAYDEVFAKYLEQARKQAAPEPMAWMNSLTADRRAHRVNDLVTVRVVENITASGSADSALSKSSSAAIGLPNLFGLESKLPSPVNPASLVSGKQDTTFKGAGTTNRASELTANLTARVSEVLPNGDLVVEGIREIQINGDRQVVVLTGVARITDLSPDNSVLSTSLGQLRIRYFGHGLMKDSLSPGWLVRMLNKIF